MKNKSSINLEVTLTEIIISILIFAAAGAITLNCFGIARYTQMKSNDITNASMKAQSSFELIKTSAGSKESDEILKREFNEISRGNNITAYEEYYNENWKECSKEDREFTLAVEISRKKKEYGKMDEIKITVKKESKYPFIKGDDKNLFSISTKKFYPDFGNGGSI